MTTLFNLGSSTKGEMIKINATNLRSDGVSHIIKCWRLGKPEQAVAMVDFLLRKKLTTKSYILHRAIIFAYEDGSLETIKAVSGMLGDYNITKMRGTRTSDGLLVNYDSGEGDQNVFWRIIYYNAVLPKRRESKDGVDWIQALDDGLAISKQRNLTKQVSLPSRSIDKHTKTGKELHNKGIKLDERYSGNDYGNKYMELEYEKYHNLDPERVDTELEDMVKSFYYPDF